MNAPKAIKKVLNFPNIWLIIQAIHRAVNEALTFKSGM
jgi:hypothetical protein